MVENKLICPILCLTKSDDRCQKEKCAWWIEDKQKCAIAVRIGDKR